MSNFHIISCHVLWRELCFFAAQSKNTFTFQFLEQGLHNTPDILRQNLQQAIDQADKGNSAILLGYGLCSNGLVGIKARNTKLVIMRGHDCITFLLGSKERYREYFDKNPGTYWYTPGWIDTSEMPGEDRYNKNLETYVEKYGEDNAEYLMQYEQAWIKNYKKAAYLDFGFYDTEHYRQYTRQCSDWLGWEFDDLKGESQLIQNFLIGNWDNENFLQVNPGEIIVASHDEKIIKAQ